MRLFSTIKSVRAHYWLLSAAAMLSSGQISAAPYYWDINNSTFQSGGANPDGTWDSTNTNWNTNVYGAPGSNLVFANGNEAVFAAGTDASGPYTVRVVNGYEPSMTGIRFEGGHVTIAPTANIVVGTTNTNVEAIRLTGTPVIHVQNMDSTISTRILGDVAFTKTGVGKLTLNYGNVGGSYFNLGDSNTLNINGGTLELAGLISGDAMRIGTIRVNSGATFRYMAVNSIQNNVIIEVNTGGTLYIGAVSDYMGSIRGNGQLVLSNASTMLKITSGASQTFSGQISGQGGINYVRGAGVLTLSNVNSFNGVIQTGGNSGNPPDSETTRTATGGIQLDHKRAAQNARIALVSSNAAGNSIRFGVTDDRTFVIGNLNAASYQLGVNQIRLQDVANNAITLEVGNNNLSDTFSGILTGTGGLTKIGTGTLTLTGHYVTSGASTGNSYTGTTAVNAATANGLSAGSSYSTSSLYLDFGNAVVSPQNDIINAASHLSLGGGWLQVRGRNNASVSQTFNGTSLTPGASRITLTNGTGTSNTVLNLGAFASRTVSKGGIVAFALPTGTQSATNGITTTTGNTNGILGSWATIGNDWATAVSNGTNNNIVAFTAYNSLGGTAAAPILTSNAAANYKTDSASAITLTGGSSNNAVQITVANTTGLVAGQYITGNGIQAGTTIAEVIDGTTLRLSVATTGGALSGQTYYTSSVVKPGVTGGTTDVNTIQVTGVGRLIDIGSGNTLRVGQAGGIWHVSGTPGTTVIGTAVDSGNLTAGGADNTAGELLLNGQLVVNSRITDNGTGAVTVIKGFTGELIITGNNTYTGGTVINLGRVTNRSSTALGTGAITIRPGGQLYMNANLTNDFFISGTGSGETVVPGAIRMNNSTISGTVTLIGDAVLGQHTGTGLGTNTISGKITGDYQLGFSAGNDGGGRFTLTNTTSDYTGGLNINGINGISSPLSSQNVIVRNGATEIIPNGLGKGDVILTGGNTAGKFATLDLFGFNETINGLVSGGTIVGNYANTRIINDSTSADSTLTLGDNNATATYAGLITDGASRKIAITKIGEGVQTFAGISTYSGATTINKGTLRAGAANALSATSAVVMANDPTVMLDLNDFSQTILSLSGDGIVNLGTAAATPAAGAILTTGDATNTTYAGDIVGAGGIAKQGTGVFTLTGENTYLGTTQISAGNLQVGVAGVGQSGSGATTVGVNAILSGTGQVRGATTVEGLLRPGDSAGTGRGKITFTDVSTSSLVIAGGGTSANPRIELTLAGATGNEEIPQDGIQTASYLNGGIGDHDQIAVYGTLTLNAGSTIKVNLQSGYGPRWGDVFNLIDWGVITNAALVNNGFNVDTDLILETTAEMTANGWSWQRGQFLTDGIVYIAPEPGRALLVLLGVLGMVSRRRRPTPCA